MEQQGYNLNCERKRMAYSRYHGWSSLLKSDYLPLERFHTTRLFLLTALFLRLARTFERERTYARVDYVTGALNARFFHDLAQREIDRSTRYGRPLSIVYIDIDNFKKVNDRFGHLKGDNIFREVADGMRRGLRKMDIIARVGGDEFAILLPETGPDEAQVIIGKLQHELLAEMQEKNWPITFSIGVLTFLHAPQTVEEMLNMADALMYGVKNSGRNNIRYSIRADEIYR